MDHVPEWFQSAAQLEARLQKGLPDLLLLDLMLRGRNGLEVLSEWRKRRETRELPVIIISARYTESDKVRGLGLGTEDYIIKPFGLKERPPGLRLRCGAFAVVWNRSRWGTRSR